MSRRVAFLLPDMRGGGAERVALTLINAFVERGVGVDLVLIKARGELMSSLPTEVRVVELGGERLRDALRPFARYLREARPDAVQALMWPLTVIAVGAHRLARSKARIVLADHSTLSRQYSYLSPLKLRALKASIRLFYPRADARVIVSDGAADDLARLAGLSRSSIEVIYNPVPAPPPPADKDLEVEALWGDGARILTVGTLKEEKNHPLLIRAFADLAKRTAASLMIVGGGEMMEPLKRLAAEEGVADRVIFPGFTVDPWPYYRTADLFALSSDFEGYPLVLVEAMRCGVQVVSTDVRSGPREILDQGRYGSLVPPGDRNALAAAMEERLRAPVDPWLLRERAESLSGRGPIDRYFELMLGRAAA